MLVKIITAGFIDGPAVRIHRNRIEGNEAAYGAGGISINTPHHNVDVTSNYIVGNRSLEAFTDDDSDEYDDTRTGAGAELVTYTGIFNVINNTIVDNAIVGASGPDELAELAGGLYLRAEASEGFDDMPDEGDNHPNFLAWVSDSDTPPVALDPSLSRVYNNNSWGNTTPATSMVALSAEPAKRGLAFASNPIATSSADVHASDLFVEDDSDTIGSSGQLEGGGATVRVFSNNFSDPASYAYECTENCDLDEGDNLSVDPLFKAADDGLLQSSSPLLGAADLTVPGAPTEDFYGLPISSIGAFWTRVTDAVEAIPVPVLGGPLGLPLLVVALGFVALRANKALRHA